MRFLFILLFSYSLFSCSLPKKEKAGEHDTLLLEQEQTIIEKPYDTLKCEVLTKRAEFKKKYDAVQKVSEKDSILLEVQDYLVDISQDYFRAWQGTPWDFNGHTTIPREGEIACGYLVTTILKDMGFNIPRIKWAQQASAYIVKQLSPEIKEFRNQPMSVVEKYLETSGEGLYIVGLDTHVGFIYYSKGQMSFVHANYYKREIGVMSEELIGWNPLSHSKFRIIGKIFQKEMLINWIYNTPYSA